MTEKNLKLDEIIEIECVGIKECYDFNMNTGCFFAQDFLVHNCDKCFLLHWEYHHTNDEEKFNDFEVILAKNKSGRTGVSRIKFYPEQYRFADYIQIRKNTLPIEEVVWE